MSEHLIALVALTVMEIVLGVDNIVFIAILTSRLPKAKQALGRNLGLMIALASRIVLLITLFWVTNGDVFNRPVFNLTDAGIPVQAIVDSFDKAEPSPSAENSSLAESGAHTATDITEMEEISIRDLLLFFGGVFLIFKSVHEIHQKFDTSERGKGKDAGVTFGGVLLQIAVLDVVFSLDSVITAVGMANSVWVMIIAMVVAMLVMLIFATRISDFIEAHPTLKMLALSFLILIGVMLLAESLGTHFNKGYIYFAMAFSLAVEFLNIRVHKNKKDNRSADEGPQTA
ncbi:MAG: TerC family protein [Planctomycetota bacterium]|nr:TerC family protein [Planctomycetota bacterium]